ncbi:hypothetical protein B9T20_04955 [Wohlfahrtiimonas sp. G9077]|nr:hypothetical protein B9T20_04955 [Wohlfahrtiimonas sp. G9077]
MITVRHSEQTQDHSNTLQNLFNHSSTFLTRSIMSNDYTVLIAKIKKYPDDLHHQGIDPLAYDLFNALT